MTEDKRKELISIALKMREHSYCPYSQFAVGAALLAKDGTIFTGCNVESSTHTPTICAERTAFFKAVSEGCTEFEAIAIVGAPKGEAPTMLCAPCGVCRQVMVEFCGPDFEVIMGITEENYVSEPLEKLIPYGFKLEEYFNN